MYLVLAGLFMPQVKDLSEVTEDSLLEAFTYRGTTTQKLRELGSKKVFFNCKTAEYAFMDSIVNYMEKTFELPFTDEIAKVMEMYPDYGYEFRIDRMSDDYGNLYSDRKASVLRLEDKGIYFISISWFEFYQPETFWFKYKGYQFYTERYLKHFFTDIDGFFMQKDNYDMPDFYSIKGISWRFVVEFGHIAKAYCSLLNSSYTITNSFGEEESLCYDLINDKQIEWAEVYTSFYLGGLKNETE